jgi:hypothetical protein
MMLDLDRELSIIACVKTLTSAVRRGSGAWLGDERVTFLRAELYNRDGLRKWSYADDREACRRLKIWFDHVREAT